MQMSLALSSIYKNESTCALLQPIVYLVCLPIQPLTWCYNLELMMGIKLKQSGQVTFGGSTFNRSANMRSDEKMLANILKKSGACVLPVWKGKPLVAQGDNAQLVYLPATHHIFDYIQDAPIFLGLAGDAPVFTANVSDWSPQEGSDAHQPDAFFDPSQQPLPSSGGAFVELRGVMAALSPLHAEISATARAILSWHKSHGFCATCGAKSDCAMAGWQRNCPSCATPHFPRTDPVVIMLVTHGNSVLVGRSPGWPEGMNSLLAGFVEPGETIEAAVRREVFEESGVRTGAVRYLASQPWPFPSSLMIGCQTEAESRDLVLDPAEIEDAFWISREELLEVFSGTSDRMLPPREGAIATFLLRNWLADQLD